MFPMARRPGTPLTRAARALGAFAVRHPDLALGCLAAAALWRSYVPGEILAPCDLLRCFAPWAAGSRGSIRSDGIFGDVLLAMHPFLSLAVSEARHGRWALWNPYAYCGTPVFAACQGAFLSPFSLPAYLLPMAPALALGATLRLWVAGAGTRRFLARLGCDLPASLLGAVTFMFCGPLVVWLQWPFPAVSVWLPWLLLAAEHLRESGRWRDAGLLAVVVGLQYLGGHPETSFHTLLVAAAWMLARAWGPGGWRFLARAAAAGVLGTGLATVQLLPFLSYARESLVLVRRSQHRSGVVGWPWQDLLLLLNPDWYGNPSTTRDWSADQVLGNYNESANWVGLVPLLLLPWAVVATRRSPPARFFLALALLMVLVFIHNPVFAALMHPLPLMWYLTSSRMVVVFAFAMAALAALAVGRLAPHVRWLAVALQVVTLAYRVQAYNRTSRERDWYPRTPALEFLRTEPGMYRVRMPLPNVGALYALEDPGGYDAFNPVRMSRLLGGDEAGGIFGNGGIYLVAPGAGLADFLNVRYWISPPNSPPPAPGWTMVHAGHDATVFRNPGVLPRAFLVHAAVRYPNGEACLQALRNNPRSAARVIHLEEAPAPLAPRHGAEPVPGIRRPEPGTLIVTARPSSPAYLVVTERWAPGWRAFVDSQRTRIQRTDFAFRGIPLPAGAHEVEFRYAPLPFSLGLWISLLTAGFLPLLFHRPRRPRVGVSN